MGACVLCDDRGQSGNNTLFVIKVSDQAKDHYPDIRNSIDRLSLNAVSFLRLCIATPLPKSSSF